MVKEEDWGILGPGPVVFNCGCLEDEHPDF